MFGKRDKSQILSSIVDDKDFTGGYSFLLWIVYMRTFFALAVIPISFIMLFASVYFESHTAIAICISLIITYVLLLLREYKRLKKGVSD